MVKDSDLGLFVPHDCRQSQLLNVTSPESVQPRLPTCANPVTFAIPENMTMPRIGVPSIPNLKTQQDAVPKFPQSPFEGLSQSSFPPFQNLLLAKNPYLRQKVSAFSRAYGGGILPNLIPGCQRKFVIFDQSGSEKRLIYSSSPTALNPTPVFTKPAVDGSDLNHTRYADKMNQIEMKVAEFEEVSDENVLNAKESEMHEDTEEINALLYSDDDYDDDSDDDDEVTSTGQSPLTVKNREEIQGQIGELSEQVADSDDQNKRRKLLDGEYTRSSMADAGSSKTITGVHNYDEDSKPSYAIGQNQATHAIPILDNKQLKRDTILHTVKILEGIIPGAKDKDPLLVIDIAIDYLQSIKLWSKSSGLNSR